MTLQILQNLYAELNMAIMFHEHVEEKYLASCARINLLNADIIALKKRIKKEKQENDR